MSDYPRKRLKPHAATCIKVALFAWMQKAENVGIAYTVHCDANRCWNITDLASDYYCAVNLNTDRGFTTGANVKRTLSDGSVVCAKRSLLRAELEIYANGCYATRETAYSVLADISSHIQSADTAAEFYVRSINDQGAQLQTDFEFSEPKTRLIQSLELKFDYVPSRQSIVFRRYPKQESE